MELSTSLAACARSLLVVLVLPAAAVAAAGGCSCSVDDMAALVVCQGGWGGVEWSVVRGSAGSAAKPVKARGIDCCRRRLRCSPAAALECRGRSGGRRADRKGGCCCVGVGGPVD